jgi:multidrug transporter EmrE-like cation transporter
MKPGGITWKVLAFLVASGIFFAFGEFLSKKFAQHPTLGIGASAIAVYAMGSLLWLPAIAQTNTLVITGTVWNVLAFVATAFIGTVLFSETLSPMAIGGIAFGLLSILFLSLA